jgi:hypothetical protein
MPLKEPSVSATIVLLARSRRRDGTRWREAAHWGRPVSIRKCGISAGVVHCRKAGSDCLPGHGQQPDEGLLRHFRFAPAVPFRWQSSYDRSPCNLQAPAHTVSRGCTARSI